MVLEESSTFISCLHKQIPFISILVNIYKQPLMTPQIQAYIKACICRRQILQIHLFIYPQIQFIIRNNRYILISFNMKSNSINNFIQKAATHNNSNSQWAKLKELPLIQILVGCDAALFTWRFLPIQWFSYYLQSSLDKSRPHQNILIIYKIIYKSNIVECAPLFGFKYIHYTS